MESNITTESEEHLALDSPSEAVAKVIIKSFRFGKDKRCREKTRKGTLSSSSSDSEDENLLRRSRRKTLRDSKLGDRIIAANVDSADLEKYFNIKLEFVGDAYNLNELNVEECLKVLFDFAVPEKDSRRSNDERTGKSKYDGLHINEIINHWLRIYPHLSLLGEVFDIDFKDKSKENQLKVYALSCECPNLASSSLFETHSREELQKMTFKRQASVFSRKLNLVVDQVVGRNQEHHSGASHSTDASGKLIKPLLYDIGSFLMLNCRYSGSCTFETPMYLDAWESVAPPREKRIIISKPACVYENAMRTVIIPVEVFDPGYIDEDILKGIKHNQSNREDQFENGGGSLDNLQHCLEQNSGLKDKYEISSCLKQIKSKHFMQLLAVANYLLTKRRRGEREMDLTVVGLFVISEYVYVSRLEVNSYKMHCVTRSIYQHLNDNDCVMATESWLKGHKEKEMDFAFSRWCLDIAKPVQRQSLLIFLAQYIEGCQV